MKYIISKKANLEPFNFGDDGVILYDSEKKNNIIMNPVCYTVWNLCDHMSIEEMAEKIHQESNDAPAVEIIENDIRNCMHQFIESGLITMTSIE